MSSSNAEQRSRVGLTPLRWAGSKKRLIGTLSRRAPPRYGKYIEPFAGSAVLFFELAPRLSILSDCNADVINFLRELRKNPVELIARAQSIGSDKEEYCAARARLDGLELGAERAAVFWYLNRHCFNGIFRTNRRGGFNVPMGRKLPPLPSVSDAIRWSAALQSADIIHADFALCERFAENGDLVYLDPPYASDGVRDRGEYGVGALKSGEIDRVIAVAERCVANGAYVLLSYNRDLSHRLKGWRHELVSVRRDISAKTDSRRCVSEYVFRNY